MKTKRSDIGSMDIRNSIFGIIPRMGNYLIPNGRRVFALAIAASITITCTAALSGCTASSQQTKDTGHTHSAPKFNGHHRDVQ